MVFDLKKTFLLVRRRYVGPTIVVLLLLSGGMTYVWGEYRKLLVERNNIAADRIAVSNDAANLEKNRANVSIMLNQRKLELDKREFILQQVEGQNKEKLALLEKRAAEFEEAFGRLKSSQSSVAGAQRQKEIEEKIQSLMAEFSAMGIDLNGSLRCDDVEGEKRFNMAKAKYTEIYAVAEANGLTNKYNNFFFHNGRHMHLSCRK